MLTVQCTYLPTGVIQSHLIFTTPHPCHVLLKTVAIFVTSAAATTIAMTSLLRLMTSSVPAVTS